MDSVLLYFCIRSSSRCKTGYGVQLIHRITKGFIPKLIQERETERDEWEAQTVARWFGADPGGGDLGDNLHRDGGAPAKTATAWSRSDGGGASCRWQRPL